MARVEVEAKEAEAHLGRWRAAVATTAAARGAQRLLGALVQRHQYLDWQNARTKRVLGLTYLQVTRAAGKHERALALKVAYLEGRAELVRKVAPHTITPPCKLRMRPLLPKTLFGAAAVERCVPATPIPTLLPYPYPYPYPYP